MKNKAKQNQVIFHLHFILLISYCVHNFKKMMSVNSILSQMKMNVKRKLQEIFIRTEKNPKKNEYTSLTFYCPILVYW